MNFAGKVCIVTGASSGIGRRTALDFAADGAEVCVVARREALLVDLVDQMGGDSRGHSYVAADVSVLEDVGRIGAHVRARHRRCDVLVNNAGFSRPGSFAEHDALEKLDEVMATNFFGAARLTKELLPLLVEAAPSSVVNVASIAGRLALGGAGAYCASKFALVGFSEALNFDLAPLRVHVGLVEPGPVPTEGFPQRDLLGDRLLRRAVSSADEVSRAIRKSAAGHKLQRVVPRAYHLLTIARYLSPPLYTFAQRRLIKDRARANMRAD